MFYDLLEPTGDLMQPDVLYMTAGSTGYDPKKGTEQVDLKPIVISASKKTFWTSFAFLLKKYWYLWLILFLLVYKLKKK